MELKFRQALALRRPFGRFNRTFMELKSRKIDNARKANICFNRTFMELKWRRHYEGADGVKVLIVPLWNWNTKRSEEYSSVRRFNRTFMELKSWSAACIAAALSCFNRTFMELKFL